METKGATGVGRPQGHPEAGPGLWSPSTGRTARSPLAPRRTERRSRPGGTGRGRGQRSRLGRLGGATRSLQGEGRGLDLRAALRAPPPDPDTSGGHQGGLIAGLRADHHPRADIGATVNKISDTYHLQVCFMNQEFVVKNL